MKKIIIFLCLLVVIVLGGCDEESLVITNDSKLEIYSTITLNVEKDKQNVNELAQWTINNNEIATLINNNLYVFDYGDVIVSAFIEETREYVQKTFHVVEPTVTEIDVEFVDSNTNVVVDSFYINRTYIVNVTVYPQTITDVIQFTSSNEDIAKVSFETSSQFSSMTKIPILTTYKTGNVTISVSCQEFKKDINITIAERPDKLEYQIENNKMSVGEYQTILSPLDSLLVTSSNEDVVICLNNNIIAGNPGKATITITSTVYTDLIETEEIEIVAQEEVNLSITESEKEIIQEKMQEMSLEEKIGQMLSLEMLSENQITNSISFPSGYSGTEVENVSIQDIYDRYKIGNYLYEDDYATTGSFSNASKIIYNMTSNDIAPFIMTDVGDLYYAAETNFHLPTQVVQTIDDLQRVKSLYNYYGDELAGAGINLYIDSNWDYYNSNKIIDSLYRLLIMDALKEDKIVYSTYPSSYIGDTLSRYEEQKLANRGMGMVAYNYHNYGDNESACLEISDFRTTTNYQGIIMVNVGEIYSYWGQIISLYDILNLIRNGADMISFTLSDRRWSSWRNSETFNTLDQLYLEISQSEDLLLKVDEAVERILLVKLRNNLLEGKTYEAKKYDDYAYLSQAFEEEIITLDGSFVFDKTKSVLVISPGYEATSSGSTDSSFGDAFDIRFRGNVASYRVAHTDKLGEEQILRFAEDYDQIIFVTIGLNETTIIGFGETSLYVDLIEKLAQLNKPVLGIALNSESDYEYYGNITNRMCAYGLYSNNFTSIFNFLDKQS